MMKTLLGGVPRNRVFAIFPNDPAFDGFVPYSVNVEEVSVWTILIRS